jgi:pimeloyl-ACP methyl ester carboxylesterase
MVLGGVTVRAAVVATAGALALAGCRVGGGEVAAPDHGPRLAALSAVQLVALGKQHVATRCTGNTGEPAVLLLSGYDVPMSSWDDVQAQVGAFARVCTYDRLGVGGSDAAHGQRTFTDLAADLDQVVDVLRLTRPVVLVAQDIGGLIAASWAVDHPEDLAGLVLVDATPPGYPESALELLPSGSPAWDDWEQLMSAGSNDERLDGQRAFAATRSFPVLGDVPLVALTRSISDYGPIKPGIAAALDSAWTGGQQQWAELSPLGRVQRVDLASHEIQRDRPGAVTDAVREVLSGS